MEKLDHKRLAEGEVTGHYHEAVQPSAALYNDSGQLVLDAPHGTEVRHQEHQPITVPPGQYERLLVQEFDPLAAEIRDIRD